MKRNNKFFSMLYVVLCLAFFYLPILVTMIFSFNSSKSLTRFTGFSLRWYQELLGNGEVTQEVASMLQNHTMPFLRPLSQ